MLHFVHEGNPSSLCHALQFACVASDSHAEVRVKQVNHAVREPTIASNRLAVTQLLPAKPPLQITKPSPHTLLHMPDTFFFLDWDCGALWLTLSDSFVSFAVSIPNEC